ncbi:sensor histidine kinase [Paenibacillus sp. FJAT-26967]|uniref:sensor histidine kinase n=1 Tax=Paenibacillus sp. FJAT-26967 TaxID=1729690 RepID=UPI000839574F|nr:GHKL domain-containing protein [Paenibacillus sp. FJAT-26967]
MSIKNLSIVFLTVVLAVLVINNTVFFYSTKNSLVTNMESELFTVSQQIQLSIDHVEYSYETTDRLMSDSLKKVAIAARNSLPARYEEITNEKLLQLSRLYHVSNITLFARQGNDIISVRSSEPKELNMNTREWGNYHTALSQLLNGELVTVPEGTASQNFWTGKLSGSASNPDSPKNKFAYYYDGTTNYIINPMINSSALQELDSSGGTELIVEETLKNNSRLLEITGFNPRTFSKPDDDPSFYTYTNQSRNLRYSERKILFGQYTKKSPEDIAFIEKAVSSNKPVSYTTKIDDRNVLKMFYPVKSEKVQFPYVIGLVTDMEHIHESLNKQLFNFFLIILLVSLASFLLIVSLYKAINRSKDSIAQTIQDNYTNEMNNLMVAIKGQNHDFANHLTTISCMVQLKKFDETKKYIHELVEETRLVNEMVHVGHPALASLISSKLTQSFMRKIHFTYDLDHLGGDLESISGLKSVDIVKILGNLIDNAFDEVSHLDVEKREVHLACQLKENHLIFHISNTTAEPISEDTLNAMFKSGYSTKTSGNHKGLGLAIVSQLVQRYKGSISVQVPEINKIQFTVILPIDS